MCEGQASLTFAASVDHIRNVDVAKYIGVCRAVSHRYARPYSVVVAMPPIETARLRLRPFTAQDAEDFAARRSEVETARFQAWRVPYSTKRARRVLRGSADASGPRPGHWFQLDVERLTDGRTVGDVAAYLHGHGRTAELGYTLHTWARRQGYATEAATALIDYLIRERGVHRIEASTHPDNDRSIRVLQRLGFTREGLRREAFWVDDEVSDDALYGLLAHEWRAARTARRS